jgi:hypothetical protein
MTDPLDGRLVWHGDMGGGRTPDIFQVVLFAVSSNQLSRHLSLVLRHKVSQECHAHIFTLL